MNVAAMLFPKTTVKNDRIALCIFMAGFFAASHSVAQIATMEIGMPYSGPKEKALYIKEATITLLPANKHQLFFFDGAEVGNQPIMWRSMDSTHAILLRKKMEVAKLPKSFSKNAHQLHVIIKPDAESTYEDMKIIVDALEKLKIKFWMFDDITAEELKAIQEIVK